MITCPPEKKRKLIQFENLSLVIGMIPCKIHDIHAALDVKDL